MVFYDVFVGVGVFVGDCDFVGFFFNDGGFYLDWVCVVIMRLVVGWVVKLEKV